MTKSTLSLVSVGVVGLSWLLARLQRKLSDSAPLGYEDEGGFHFGAPMNKE